MPALSAHIPRTLALAAACDFQGISDASQRAREFLAGAGLGEAELDGWKLVLAEAGSNAVRSATPEGRHRPVCFEVSVSENRVEVRVTDHTAGFDFPEKAELPPVEAESGRGLFLLQTLTDEAVYLRGRGENCLVLRKNRTPGTGPPASQTDPWQELEATRRTLDLMTEELAASFESLSAIFRFSAELHTANHPEEFMQRWLQQLLAVSEAEWYVLRLADRTGRVLRMGATSQVGWSGVPLSLEPAPADEPGIEVRAVRQQADVWFGAAAPLPASEPLAVFGAGAGGFAHPIFVNDALVGVLAIGRCEGEPPFRAGQVNVIQTFADFLGIQIRSQVMREEEVRARLDVRDLEIAAGIQRTLLPQDLPSPQRASLAGFYRSARDIGGDYYDAYSTEDGGVFLVVADVMGKGLPAALFSFMLRSLVRARRDLAPRPGEFLAWLNQNLFDELDRAGMFITVQLAFLDCPRGVLRVSSAGHPPLLTAGPSGEVSEVSAGGPPLGIVAGAAFPEAHHPCHGGRALMFTDGLTEARNPAGALLGLEAVKAALAAGAVRGESSDAIKQRFIRLQQEFEQGTPPADDTAFIVIGEYNCHRT